MDIILYIVCICYIVSYISTQFFSSRTSKSLSSANFPPLGKPNLCYIQIGICGIYSILHICRYVCMYICVYILRQWGSSAFLCRFIFGSTSSFSCSCTFHLPLPPLPLPLPQPLPAASLPFPLPFPQLPFPLPH